MFSFGISILKILFGSERRVIVSSLLLPLNWNIFIRKIGDILVAIELLIVIIDSRSIANAYYYGVLYAQPGLLLRMHRSTSRAHER